MPLRKKDTEFGRSREGPQSNQQKPERKSFDPPEKTHMKTNTSVPTLVTHSPNPSPRWSEAGNSVRAGRGRSAWLLGISATALLAWGQAALAFDFLPLGEGKLPTGEIVSMFQVTFAPGESFPWHFHPGRLLGVVTTGTLTEDVGCSSPMEVHPAGSAFSEKPGAVHRVFNFGTVPVVINFTAIVPSCYGGYNSTILVTGPTCEGDSDRSRLEKVPPCNPDAAEQSNDRK